MYKIKFMVALLVFSLLIAACGPAETATPAMTEPPVMTEAPTEAATQAATEAPTEAATEAPVAGEIDCKGAQPGDEISMLYQWSGVEEEALNSVLQPLIDACGIVLRPESTRDQALLDTRVQAGTPPDVTFWTLAAAIRYQDELFAMDELGADAANYPDFFRNTGTINGKWVALPVKADIKTMIWYSPIVFEAKGYTVPTTWDELVALVD